jgi:hypothetical protein
MELEKEARPNERIINDKIEECVKTTWAAHFVRAPYKDPTIFNIHTIFSMSFIDQSTVAKTLSSASVIGMRMELLVPAEMT